MDGECFRPFGGLARNISNEVPEQKYLWLFVNFLYTG